MSELSDKALTAIQDAVRVEIIKDKEGNEYSTKACYSLRLKDEQPASPGMLNLHTLTGFIDFCNRNKEKTGPEDPAIVHIFNHGEVFLISEPFGPEKKRTQFAKSSFESLLGTSFKFGEYYDQESFIVGLQSLFEPTPSRALVLKVIGTIQENIVKEFADDGVTQSVAAKAGQVLVKEIEVPNPVFLKPFRTFREIGQPESPFVLRVRTGKEKPQCALFEADGGRWKLTAIQLIKEYLESKVALPIIA
jgi:hypothetical protein